MVIPSDITRWGFVEEIPTSEEEIEYATVTTSYSGNNWRILISKDADKNGQKELHIYYCDGDHRCKAIVETPGQIYELLKKVGYLE